jgi:exopolyphosphatase/guanosine-5'-triphosphate,3'-diphosphate pyrophosphatase
MDSPVISSMRAAIDIGTNTVLLLAAEVNDGVISPIHEEHRVPRLGKGVDTDKNINEAATQRVILALKEYKELLLRDFPDLESVVVTATSAVRDARNREEFMQSVKKETGFTIRLLSGTEEAEWTAYGALSVLGGMPQNRLIIDIGGGSTEVAALSGMKITDAHSFDMGSVRFTERFLRDDPPKKEQISACRKGIESLLNNRPFDIKKGAVLVGVAGTVTTLAGISLGLTEYQPEKLNGYVLTLESIRSVIERFSVTHSQKMLKEHPVYLKGRADIFMAGMLILEGLMEQFDIQKLIASTGGIRHGAILKAQKKRH